MVKNLTNLVLILSYIIKPCCVLFFNNIHGCDGACRDKLVYILRWIHFGLVFFPAQTRED